MEFADFLAEDFALGAFGKLGNDDVFFRKFEWGKPGFEVGFHGVC
jgi:hypothetical protein